LAAISLAGSTYEMPLEDIAHLANELLQTSSKIGRALMKSMTPAPAPSVLKVLHPEVHLTVCDARPMPVLQPSGCK
jgi:hypothetical protein